MTLLDAALLFKRGSCKIALWKGDITKLQVDAIVNAANDKLKAGGGKFKAAGWKQLQEECMKLNGCATGQAKTTNGYNLQVKKIIHAVGPIGENPVLLSQAYKSSLNLAKENNLVSIAFPCISTGIYGYPQEAAAEVAINTVKEWLDENASMELIIFCVFLEEDFEIYKKLLPENFVHLK